MSKADRLGGGAAFGRAATARSSRRDAIDKAIQGGDTTTAAITDLPVTLISDNPGNPRNHLRNLEETVESVREVGVILPIVIATVDAYLRDRPDRGDDLDDGAQYVVIDGHRRLESARRAGLATIPVRVDNARVSTDQALLEAAFVANYHRDDMTDLEEAHALKQLVDYYGSQTKAAKRLGLPQGTISSKLSLLKLAPELQKDLMTGARKVEHVRNLGKLSPAEQKSKADERARTVRRKIETRTSTAAEATPPPADSSDYHGVIITETTTSPADGSPALPPADVTDQPAEGQPAAEAIPEPRGADSASGHQPRTLPYDDPVYVAMHLEAKMSPEDFLKATRLMAAKCWERVGLEPSLDLLRDVLATAVQRDPDSLRVLLEHFATEVTVS